MISVERKKRNPRNIWDVVTANSVSVLHDIIYIILYYIIESCLVDDGVYAWYCVRCNGWTGCSLS